MRDIAVFLLKLKLAFLPKYKGKKIGVVKLLIFLPYFYFVSRYVKNPKNFMAYAKMTEGYGPLNAGLR
jgi:hypothetical protein